MTQGQDPPVLLVHGFASSAEHNWRHPGWLDLLADCGRETIAVDLPGHGTAPKPADPAGYQEVEAHVAAAVQGREPLDAIGFSAGAQVLLRLAADQPGTFRRLALLGIGRGVLEPADRSPSSSALTSEPTRERERHGVPPPADGLGNDRDALIALLRFAAAAADCSRPPGTTQVLVVLGDQIRLPRATAWSPRCRTRGWSLRGVGSLRHPADVRCMQAVLGFLGC
jgi:pimeloyl-ACP methyl ester carboxylesterase